MYMISANVGVSGAGVIADADGWGHHMGEWGWGMAIFGWLFMALLVVLVVWLIWTVARRPELPRSDRPHALDVLADRYARGEIDRDQYLERKADLER
jgi:putative membrane protein